MEFLAMNIGGNAFGIFQLITKKKRKKRKAMYVLW